MLEQLFSPLMVLDVLPKLISRAAFLMTRFSEEGGHLLPPKKISEKELVGYCSYYHLLLYMCHHYPAIQEKIENQLQLFLQRNSPRGIAIHFGFLYAHSFHSGQRSKFGRITCVSFCIHDSHMAGYGHCIFTR